MLKINQTIFSSQFKSALSLISFILLSQLSLGGCAVGQLNYQVDPEITNLETLAQNASLVSINVVDNRKKQTNNNQITNESKTIYANGPEEIASLFKTKLLNNFKNNGFKIISNPLLADVALEFHIETLQAKVTSSFFKSSIEVISHIRLKANKKRQPFEKLFKTAQYQSVVKPAKSNEVTGVVNQALSLQLSSILSDKELLIFVVKP